MDRRPASVVFRTAFVEWRMRVPVGLDLTETR
jgi:hypothetical protein